MRHLASLAALVAAALAFPASAVGQAPALELKVQKVEFSRGEAFPLELVITAPANQPVSGVDVVGLGAFEVQAGPDVAMSVQVDMRRGASVATHSYRYSLAPRTLGTFMLGPATATVGGATFRSNSVALKVVEESQSTQGLPSDPQMFLAATADKTTAVAGEQVIVTYSLYSRVNYFGLELRREPTTDGFWVEEIDVPRGYAAYTQQNLNGQIYRVQILKRQAMFPLRTGTITIGSMVLDAAVGGGFFGGGQKLARASKPLAIEVQPLPAHGKPPGFLEPNVGRYTLSGGVDRMQVAMGEAVKYRVNLEGTGNIKGVVLPELPQGQAYRRFDPEPKVTVRVDGQSVVGTRTLDYLLSPSEPGRMVIPAIAFHFYDPIARQYQTQTIPETVVTVSGGAGVGAAKGQGATPTGPLPGSDPDLRPLRETISVAGAGRFHRGGIFWALIFAPPLCFGLLLLFGRARAFRSELRQKSEPRRRAAHAYKRLREAERLLEADNADAFFGELSRVLTTFLEAKLGQQLGSLTLPELERTLLLRGYSADSAAGVVRELENCDFGRFAPRDSRREEMRNAMQRSRGLLDALERIRPTPLPSATVAEAAR